MNQVERKEIKKKPSKVSKTIPSTSLKVVGTEKEPLKTESVVQLEKELAELRKWKEDNLRKLANQLNQLREIEEWKKKETIEIEKYGKQNLLKKIVDFLVNLESRVVKAMHNYPDPQGIVLSHVEGIEIALDNLKQDLEKEGVREMKIKTGTDLWNSLLHKSIAEVGDKKLPARTVVEVVENGYMLHERVLRAAKVKISKK